MTDAVRTEPRAGKAFYVTTPIYYVNDAPHIGHAYTTVAGDVLTRWHRQRGEDVWFLTGTDEHGQKVLRGRRGRRRRPRRSGPTGSSRPRGSRSCETIDVANDDFIRTTEPRHTRAGPGVLADALRRRARSTRARTRARTAWPARSSSCPASCSTATGDRGPAALPDPRPPGRDARRRRTTSSGCPRTPTGCSRSTRRTRTFVAAGERAQRGHRRSSQQGLQDLSITRSTFDWGIPVPWDDTHVLYVWIDALLNYATAVGLRHATRRARSRAPGRPTSTSSARTSCASTR